jgi:hypothetical protein
MRNPPAFTRELRRDAVTSRSVSLSSFDPV